MPPHSFGRHTSLLVSRSGSILQAFARMGLPVLRPPLYKVGIVVHVPDAGDDTGGGVGAGAMPATTMPSQEGYEGAPPPEGDAPLATSRVSFAGGMHIHINTQTGQVIMASWLARGYEDKLCRLLMKMGVTEREVSPRAPRNMVRVLSCPPNSFGRHTSLLVTRAGSIASLCSHVVACFEAISF